MNVSVVMKSVVVMMLMVNMSILNVIVLRSVMMSNPDAVSILHQSEKVFVCR